MFDSLFHIFYIGNNPICLKWDLHCITFDIPTSKMNQATWIIQNNHSCLYIFIQFCGFTFHATLSLFISRLFFVRWRTTCARNVRTIYDWYSTGGYELNIKWDRNTDLNHWNQFAYMFHCSFTLDDHWFGQPLFHKC